MKVEILHKRIYGQDRFYPKNKNAEAVCKILGRKSLTHHQLTIGKKAGWEIVITTEQFKLDDNL